MDKVDDPVIPSSILVHLGKPDEAAENVSVSFIDYIKNVASSEIYPSWPEEAIKANIYVQISFALNRIYNEWYRSKGYNFDITSLPAYDQTFVKNRDYYDNIAKLVDEIFNSYLVKGEQIQPFFSVYCDGKKTTCDGLSQWGSVELANNNKKALDILKHYYGDDTAIVSNVEIADFNESYQGEPIKIGYGGNMVRTLQRELNRIRINYPAIPKITKIAGVFDKETEDAVKKFQEIFNLEITGVVNQATWYKIKYIYSGVKKLFDISSEGLSKEDVSREFNEVLKEGDTGMQIRVLHYYILVIAFFDADIPRLEVNSVFNNNTKMMLIEFQKKFGLPATGEVDLKTWLKLNEIYAKIINSLPKEYQEYGEEFYPGYFLSLGMSGPDVERLQKFLLKICQKKHSIPGVKVTGEFDTLTQQSVKKIQQQYQMIENGSVGPVTWYNIVEESKS